MNVHKNARLTPRGRGRIVRQVESGQTPEAVAEAAGVWYDIIAIPTLADAVLDRVVHNAYRIELAGESLRKQKAPTT